MIRRRLLYLLLLAVSFLYFVFHTVYPTFLLFVVILLLPVISILASVPLLLKCRLQLEIDPAHSYHKNESIRVRHNLTATLMTIRFDLCFENQFYSTTKKQRMYISTVQCDGAEIPLDRQKSGVVRCSVKRPRALDFLGLFFLPLRRVGAAEILILPKEIPFSGSVNS